MSFWNNKNESPAPEAPPRPEKAASPAAQKPAEPPPALPEPARVEPPPAPVSRDAAPPTPEGLRLGRGVRLEGKLTFSGTVRIDATFQGSIATGGVLVVGEGARVDAEVACGTVVVEGELNGNVVAREAVELRRTAKMRGDIESPALTVERGAVFDGSSRRPAALASAGGGKAAAAPAPSVH